MSEAKKSKEQTADGKKAEREVLKKELLEELKAEGCILTPEEKQQIITDAKIQAELKAGQNPKATTYSLEGLKKGMIRMGFDKIETRNSLGIIQSTAWILTADIDPEDQKIWEDVGYERIG